MAELLVSPDVVALCIAHVKSVLPTIPNQSAVPVHRSVPDPRPAAFVTCRLAGGEGRSSALPVVDIVQVNFEAWGATVAAAHDLAQNARAAILSAKGAALSGVQVYNVEDFGPPVELPDPLSGRPRFVFSVQLSVRIRRPVA